MLHGTLYVIHIVFSYKFKEDHKMCISTHRKTSLTEAAAIGIRTLTHQMSLRQNSKLHTGATQNLQFPPPKWLVSCAAI